VSLHCVCHCTVVSLHCVCHCIVCVTALCVSLHCVCHCTVCVTALCVSLHCVCHCTVCVTALCVSLHCVCNCTSSYSRFPEVGASTLQHLKMLCYVMLCSLMIFECFFFFFFLLELLVIVHTVYNIRNIVCQVRNMFHVTEIIFTRHKVIQLIKLSSGIKRLEEFYSLNRDVQK
jgi:hypothetical protein